MKLAIIIPVGPLDRMGYQRHYMTTIESWSAVADRVIMYSSTRNTTGKERILSAFDNVEYVSNEETWLRLDENGEEYFDVSFLQDSTNRRLQDCQKRDFDVAVIIEVQQYLPEYAAEPFRQLCQKMLDEGRPIEWLYKKYQLGDRLLVASVRQPRIFNLRHDPVYTTSPVVLTHDPDKTDVHQTEYGDYSAWQDVAIVDFGLEVTRQELEEFLKFVRYYNEWHPENPIFEEQLQRYRTKFYAKEILHVPLDRYGQRIAAASGKDFVSQQVLVGHPDLIGESAPERLKMIYRRLLPSRLRRGLRAAQQRITQLG